MRLIRLLKKDLAREISTWVDQELITPDQARAVCRRYGIDYDSIDERATGYRLLVALGYLFIGLAVITLLGANWDQIPRAVRLVGLIAITIGTHGIALRTYLAEKESTAASLFLLANLFYGASIILIAQIYHLGEHMPDGVFWWALGSLPIGVLLRHTWLTLFSLLLALVWLFIEYGMGFYPTLFPVFIAAAVYVLIVGRPSATLFLTTVASIGLWVEISLAAAWADDWQRYDLEVEHFAVTVALFVFAYAFSHWLNVRDSAKATDYGVLLSVWSLRFGLIAMLVLTFADPWEELIRADWEHQAAMWQIVILLFGGAVWFGWKARKLATVAPIVAFCGLSLIVAIASDNPDDAVLLQIFFNVALVAAGIALIVRGMRSGISHYFFLGVAAILLVAFLRYIDLIGDYVGGAVLFIVMAAILLGAARYWKAVQRGELGV